MAQIGQDRSAGTRSELIRSAGRLMRRRAADSITVEDVEEAAGAPKGTFSVHFRDMDVLILAVAHGLIEEFVEMLQPRRISLADPLARIAFYCASFIEEAIENPGWASVVVRISSSAPLTGCVARERLCQDVKDHAALKPQECGIEPAIVTEAVLGALMHVVGAISSGRIDAAQGRAALEPILRIAEATPTDIRRTIATVVRLLRPEKDSGSARKL